MHMYIIFCFLVPRFLPGNLALTYLTYKCMVVPNTLCVVYLHIPLAWIVNTLTYTKQFENSKTFPNIYCWCECILYDFLKRVSFKNCWAPSLCTPELHEPFWAQKHQFCVGVTLLKLFFLLHLNVLVDKIHFTVYTQSYMNSMHQFYTHLGYHFISHCKICLLILDLAFLGVVFN